jgi:hypothetical protein
MVWYGMVWYGMVLGRKSMVWYGIRSIPYHTIPFGALIGRKNLRKWDTRWAYERVEVWRAKRPITSSRKLFHSHTWTRRLVGRGSCGGSVFNSMGCKSAFGHIGSTDLCPPNCVAAHTVASVPALPLFVMPCSGQPYC